MAITNSNTAGGTLQSQANQPVAKPKQMGSGFTNLQKVIGANKGNQLGTAVSTGMGNRVGQIKTDLADSQNKFQTDLQGNRVDTDENKSFVNTALSDPYAASQNADNVTKFQNLMKGDYAGPTQLGNSDALNAQAQEAAQYGNSATTAAGRNTLLQRYAGGNNYTQGQQRLDGLLLGQTGANDLKQVRRDASGLSSQINNATTTAESQAQAAAAANKGFASDINNQLGTYDDPTTDDNEGTGIYGSIQSDLNAKLKAFQDAQSASYNNLHNAVTTNQYNDDALNALGLKEGQKTYGANLDQYLTAYDPNTANVGNVANADDYNKYMALNKLAGRDNTLLTNRANAGTAAAYTAPDQALIKQAIDNAGNAFNSQYAGNGYKQFVDQLVNSGGINLSGNATDADKYLQYLSSANMSGSGPGATDYSNFLNNLTAANRTNPFQGTTDTDNLVRDFLSRYDSGVTKAPTGK